tara:strand:+ start:113 stop:559 length:447 start_codon:yes stop_codon:yes gene_type:complete
MGTKRVGWARIQSLINENANTLQQRRYVTQTISSDTTLTTADAGQIIFCNGASAVDLTLPASDDAGLWFRFVLSDNTADVDIIQGDAASDFVGSVMCLSNKDTATASDTKVSFKASTALAGDWIEVVSNGDDWLIRGQSAVNSGIVFS